MKNLLFATTALVATTGMAAAEVKFSGYGRFGLSYNEDRARNSTALTGRVDELLLYRDLLMANQRLDAADRTLQELRDAEGTENEDTDALIAAEEAFSALRGQDAAAFNALDSFRGLAVSAATTPTALSSATAARNGLSVFRDTRDADDTVTHRALAGVENFQAAVDDALDAAAVALDAAALATDNDADALAAARRIIADNEADTSVINAAQALVDAQGNMDDTTAARDEINRLVQTTSAERSRTAAQRDLLARARGGSFSEANAALISLANDAVGVAQDTLDNRQAVVDALGDQSSVEEIRRAYNDLEDAQADLTERQADLNFVRAFGNAIRETQSRVNRLNAVAGSDFRNNLGDYTISLDGPDSGSDVSDTILASRFRLNIDAIQETDSGVRFSARIRIQADEDDDTENQNAASLNGARFSVEYGGLRVDAGNVSGSFDTLSNYYGNEPGLENFIGQYAGVNYSFLGYSSTGTGANAVFFNYAVGNFGFSASYDTNATVTVSERVAYGENVLTASREFSNVDRWDVSATYTFDNITAALAYGENDLNESLTVLTVGAELGDFTGSIFLADDDVMGRSLNGTAYGLSAAYNLGAATTLTFAYGDGSAESDSQQFGIGAIHDLGAGVSLRGGIGQTKIGDGDGRIRADFGAQFNF